MRKLAVLCQMFEVQKWFECVVLRYQVISYLSSHVLAKHFVISFITNVQPQTVGVIHYTNVYAHNSSVTNYWERNRDLYFVPCLCSCTFKWLYFLLDPTDPMLTKCIFLFQGRVKENRRKKVWKCHKCSQAWLMIRDKAIFQQGPYSHWVSSGSGGFPVARFNSGIVVKPDAKKEVHSSFK